MSDTINRQDAIRIAEQGQIQGYPWQFEQLVKLPSAQRKGKWIDDVYRDFTCVCSECGVRQEIKAKFLFSYCPNCGAKMEWRGEDDE